MSEILIRCENVSKKFCRDLRKSLWYGIKDSAADLFSWKQRDASDERRETRNDRRDSKNFASRDSQLATPYDSLATGDSQLVASPDPLASRPSHLSSPDLRSGEFWANKDISFELRRGECLGLVGRNGAGKTTLLKMLNGLIKPDHGRIEMRGKVGAMIALGAGFNPILTGRENVFINGSILGLSKRQISDRFEEILDFGEIAEFIDMPVKYYSSGMQVRLGFAVAVMLIRPDVLLLDEVLAVGDNAFRSKCINTVTKMLKDSAVIFVSHNETHVKRICDQVIYLVNGHIKLLTSDVFEAILAYNSMDLTQPVEQNSFWITPKAEVLSYSVTPDILKPGCKIQSTEPLIVQIKARTKVALNDCLARLIARSKSSDIVVGYEAESHNWSTAAGDQFEIFVQIDGLHLATGYYTFTFVLLDKADHQIIFKATEFFEVSVVARYVHGGVVNLNAQLSLMSYK